MAEEDPSQPRQTRRRLTPRQRILAAGAVAAGATLAGYMGYRNLPPPIPTAAYLSRMSPEEKAAFEARYNQLLEKRLLPFQKKFDYYTWGFGNTTQQKWIKLNDNVDVVIDSEIEFGKLDNTTPNADDQAAARQYAEAIVAFLRDIGFEVEANTDTLVQTKEGRWVLSMRMPYTDNDTVGKLLPVPYKLQQILEEREKAKNPDGSFAERVDQPANAPDRQK